MKVLMRVHAGLGVLLFSLFTAGCGGGSSNSNGMSSDISTAQSCSASSCGSAMVTMTDAQGDFLTYAVTLNSLQLKKASGAVVETLPKATKIDFAQLVDLSEVMSATQIPAGDYVGASITVDYTGATLIVDDGSANGLTVSAVDRNGAAVTQITLDVQLDNKNHLIIAPGRVARLAFDFNLLASNTVDMTTAKVTVQPFVVASVMPADTKQVRVRGALSSVDTANSDYIVNVLPFHESSNSVGQVTVHTTAQTTYEINGTAYKGAAGLIALAALPANSVAAAFGTVQTSDMSFTAANVLAGSSIENANLDHLIGDVIARTGNTLTVRGIEVSRHDGSFEFGRGNIAVTVGANTVVTGEGQAAGGAFDISAISVGQRVDVFGTETANSSGTSFDATTGRVRLDLTPLWGIVTNTVAPTIGGSGGVTLNLQAIDGRPASVYNFAGTGTSAATDAKPASYLVNTQSLTLSGLVMNAPTRLFGFVAPFGSAPPNFTANTLVDYSSIRASLAISWGMQGTTAPFSVLNNTDLALDLSNANIGAIHEIEFGPLHIDLKSLSASPMIVPSTAASGLQLYSIGHVTTHKIENFNSFTDFETALTTELNGSTVAYGMAAEGQYNNTANTFTADHLIVVINN